MCTKTGIAASIFLVVVSLAGADSPRPDMTEGTLSGQVVSLTAALDELRIPVDRDSSAAQVVLRAADGTLVPLIRDEASRAFFMDPRLLSRDAELRVRRYSGVPYVQVISFKLFEAGKFRTPEYYCEVCSISVRYPQTCPCCQREMEFRFRPDR